MTIVWAVVIAVAFIIEFLSYGLVSIFFFPAALISLVLAAVGVGLEWQVIVFVVSSLVFVLAFRPIVKKYLIRDTVHTNITDINIGKRVRLTGPVKDGESTIEINGVTWTAKVVEGGEPAEGTLVEIIGASSNEFRVKPI